MTIPKWFRVLIASFCIFGVAMLFFGANNSSTTKLREADASIGLIRRPKSNNILDSAKYFFKPIKTEAFVVSIAADAPRIIEKIIRVAIAFAISAIIGLIINKITDFFGDIINKMGTWIGVTTGLRDSVSSLNAAMGLKAFQISECLNQSADSVIRKIFNDTDLTKNSVARDIAEGAGLAGGAAGSAAIEGSKQSCRRSSGNITSSKNRNYQLLKNAITGVGIDSVVNFSLRGNSEGLTGDEDKETFRNQTEENGADLNERLDSQKLIDQVKSEEDTEATIENIEQIAEGIACGEDEPETPVVREGSAILLETGLTKVSVSCTPADSTAQTKAAIREYVEVKQEAFEAVVDNYERQAPSDCKIGFLSDGFGEIQSSGTELANEQFLNSSDFSISEGTIDLASATIQTSDKVGVNAYNKEQCESQNRLPALQDNISTTASSNSSGSAEAIGSVNTLLSTVQGALTQLKDNILKAVFEFAAEAAVKIISKIGNAYVSQAISKATGTSLDSAERTLSNITSQYIDRGFNGSAPTAGPTAP